MKKTISIVLILFAVSTQGQIGIKYGANGSTFIKGTDPDIRHKISLTGGLYAHIKLSNTFALQPSLEYVSKGSLINHDNAPATDRFRLNQNYVQFPIVLRIGAGQFKVELGGYGGYLYNVNISKFNYGTVKNFDESVGFKRWAYGAIGGIAYKWDWVTFNARIEEGLQWCSPGGLPLERFKERNISFTMEVPLN